MGSSFLTVALVFALAYASSANDVSKRSRHWSAAASPTTARQLCKGTA
ncbi:MAG: hypothetical protein MRJ92_02305 [Nitrospira sp.]|nr:hypothetical protein [Nitrospira sp.]